MKFVKIPGTDPGTRLDGPWDVSPPRVETPGAEPGSQMARERLRDDSHTSKRKSVKGFVV